MKYRVHGAAALVGLDMLLRLTDEQAAARRHAIEPADEKPGPKVKLWRPLQVLTFKVGEEIDIDRSFEELPRSLALVLEPIGRQSRKASPTAKEPAGKPAAGEDDGAGRDDDDDGSVDDDDDDDGSVDLRDSDEPPASGGAS